MGLKSERSRVLTAILFLAAPVQAQVKNPSTFVFAMVGDVDSLDPHWQYDFISHGVVANIYEPLIAYKGDSVTELEPRIASKLPSKGNRLISVDNTSYTFPIRQGVRFHDGTPLTPEDVKYSLMRYMLMDRSGGSAVLLLEPILGRHETRASDGSLIAAAFDEADQAIRVDGQNVVIRLKKPFAPFLHALASFCQIVSKEHTVKNGGWDGTKATWAKFNNIAKENSYLHDHPNGTGPFKFERWDQREKKIVLSRHEGYWRAPAKLETVIFKTVDEFNSRKLLLSAGDADAVFVERQFLPQVSQLAGVAVDDTTPLLEVHNAFVFNLQVKTQGNPYTGSGRLDGEGIPPDFFSDVNVRKGFAHAFDYDAYVRDGYRGRAERARGPILKDMLGYNPAQPLIPFDLAKAAEHLKKAHDGKVWENGFRFSLIYLQGRSDRLLAANILKKNIESLNPKFRVDIHGILWSTYLAAWIAGKLPMTNSRWALDYPDPHNCVFPYMHPEGHFARTTGYNNPKATALIDKAVLELDSKKRMKYYFDLQKIAYEDVPAIFTADTYYLRVRRAWVKNWDYNSIKYVDLYPVYKENQ